MLGIPADKIAVGAFGVIFIATLMIIAIRFPRPTPFQYTVFRIILAISVAGIAPFIPGMLDVQIAGAVKAGGAIAVFVIVYFFSPAGMIAERTQLDLPMLVKVWEGIRAPREPLDPDMSPRALNALNQTAWYWGRGTESDKRLIKSEAYSPYEQWYLALHESLIVMSDGKSAKEHLRGTLATVYREMKDYG